jgi:bifunctional non-homologous end joining protein LigD
MFKHACKTGLEGVVSKVRDSHYSSGRSNDWVKVTCAQDLIYAGKVDHGFDKSSAKDLQARLKPLIRKTQPYAKKIAHRGVWAEPSLLAEIEYRASAAGKVRHPFFKGLREDL